MFNFWMSLRGKEYQARRFIEKKFGKVKAENRKLKEEICWLKREKEQLIEKSKLPF